MTTGRQRQSGGCVSIESIDSLWLNWLDCFKFPQSHIGREKNDGSRWQLSLGVWTAISHICEGVSMSQEIREE